MADQAMKVLLAQKWSDSKDPTGWWMSEKLDGVRSVPHAVHGYACALLTCVTMMLWYNSAYWTGSTFYSRQGNKFHAPAFFTADLPKTPLDGELWCGRGL